MLRASRPARAHSLAWKQGLVPYAFIAPGLLVLALIVVYPLFFSGWLSVHNFSLIRRFDRQFVGGKNFSDLLADPLFWTSLRLTGVWTIGIVASQLVLGLGVAILLNQRMRGRSVLRGIVLLPWVTPSAVVAITWLWMLNPDFGIINDILRRAGVVKSGIAWLADPSTALPSVMIATIWQGVPFFAVMLLAGLQTVPPEVLEAARVDGASAWRTLVAITIPMIAPTIIITTLLRTIWVANYVDTIFLMTGGGPGRATHTLAIFTFVTVRGRLDYGHGAALSLMLAALLAGLLSLYIWELRRETKYGGQ